MLTDISREEFREKYLLGKQVAHEGVRSFEARDTADRMVMVHLLGPAKGAEAVPWLAALSAMAPERRSGLLGAFEMDGEAVLVTELLPQVRSLADWFVTASSDRNATAQASEAQEVDVTSVDRGGSAAEDQDQGLGEFTRMFASDKPVSANIPLEEAETEEIPRVEDAAAPEPEVSEVVQPPATQAAEGQGEFTRMFGGQPDGIPAPAPPPPPQQTEESKPAATVDDQVPPTEEPEIQGGEFTQFFGAQEKTTPDPPPVSTPIEQPSPASPPMREEPPEKQAEERKGGPRIVWRDKKSKQAPPDPGQPKIRVRMANEPPSSPPIAPPKPLDPVAPPPSPVKEQPPGQFTQMFGHELPQGSEPQAPKTDGTAKDNWEAKQPVVQGSPPSDTGPRPSVSDHPTPLSGPTSDNYLKALGSDSQATPPPVPPSPKQEGRPKAPSPDLPPPITSPQPDPAPGPGDYTRVVSGNPVVPPPPAAPVPSPTPSPSPPTKAEDSGPAKMPTWLWVALVSIVLVMVLLIVLVVLT